MKRKLKLILCTSAFALFLGSCGGMKTSQPSMSADTVAIDVVNVVDTISYKIGDASQCSVMADAKIAYPNAYKDIETTAKLQRLFTTDILEVPMDSVVLDEAFKKYVNNIVSQYGVTSDSIKYEDEGREIVYKYNSKINVSVVYNKNGIITFCKEETTEKNNVVTMVSHNYYNISLAEISQIKLDNIFSEENVDDISELLKHRLLTQLDVKDESALIDLGYFNLDNLVVNNNFRISDTGITWTFRTYEIACYSVGETDITLEYEMLKPYIMDGSVILQFVE